MLGKKIIFKFIAANVAKLSQWIDPAVVYHSLQFREGLIGLEIGIGNKSSKTSGAFDHSSR